MVTIPYLHGSIYKTLFPKWKKDIYLCPFLFS